MSTFINLPQSIDNSVAHILQSQRTANWIRKAVVLHTNYMQSQQDSKYGYIQDFDDALAYLALRSPATYAQIYSSLTSVAEVMPSWQPKTFLDVGTGPGTGIWAAEEIWPSIQHITAIDKNRDLLLLGKNMSQSIDKKVAISWRESDIRALPEIENTYDLILIANVLNELTVSEREKLVGRLFNRCTGIMIIVEPGTPGGSSIISSFSKKFAPNNVLTAPYISGNFVWDSDYYLHFSQRFIRPEFQRRIRQRMRDSSLMASDWEDAKYSYVAIGKIPVEKTIWGRCVGPIKKQKGFIEVPILTKDTIIFAKVLQRHKKEYSFAKNLRWGDIIPDQENILVPSSHN